MAAVVVTNVGSDGHTGNLISGRLPEGGVPDFKELLAATLYADFIREGSTTRLSQLPPEAMTEAAEKAFEAAEAFLKEAHRYRDE
jgi:hypothetical protein